MIRVLGVGSILLDAVAQVPESFIRDHVCGGKGGMVLITPEQFAEIRPRLQNVVRTPGGSVGNTLAGLLRLGILCRMFGKAGRDSDGDFYASRFASLGGETCSIKFSEKFATGCCLSMVTPDAERTMRTCLGASSDLSADDVLDSDFEGISWVHVEGYQLAARDMLYRLLAAAKAKKIPVSLDLASFEIVRAFHADLEDLLAKYVDVVFADEDEAREYIGENNPEKALDIFCKICTTACVKLGAKGSILGRGSERAVIPAVKANAVDTTGAGDLWQAGFLYGYLHGKPLEFCGRAGSILGAEAVQIMGADIPAERWNVIREKIKNITLLKGFQHGSGKERIQDPGY